MRKIFFFFAISSMLLACSPSNTDKYYQIRGTAQGTTYNIIYSLPQNSEQTNLQPKIDSILFDFEESLSVYRPNSIISQVNQNKNCTVDAYFATVFNKAREITDLTNGAFDISASPLFSIWGWGAEKKVTVTQHMIDSIMEFVGMDKVALEGQQIVKTNPKLSLNVNAIAKGYSSDVIAQFLSSKGSTNYLVEIGGEMCLKGKNSKNQIWEIGIDQPIDGNFLPGEDLQVILQVTDRALATSGNYRRYYIENGQKYGHTIDPKTGYSAKQNLLSVTVLANDCLTADALATSFMVLGLNDSKKLIATLPGVEAYFVYDNEGFNSVDYTPGMQAYIRNLDTK